jgi:D-proline reductase (dithiol) PrdB
VGEDHNADESFAAFKDSFSYGSRSDLAFKFLKRLSPHDAAAFFQHLLTALGETIDDGDADRLVQLAYEWQARAYAAADRQYTYDNGPFTALAKPVSQARLALVTSSGHFVEGDDPQPFGLSGMTQEDATARIDDFLRVAPQLSTIPVTTPANLLRVRHGGYDIRGATRDPNVVFPLDRLRELADDGHIGDLAPDAYSFVGAAAQTRLTRETAPQWADLLRAEGADAVLLVPA